MQVRFLPGLPTFFLPPPEAEQFSLRRSSLHGPSFRFSPQYVIYQQHKPGPPPLAEDLHLTAADVAEGAWDAENTIRRACIAANPGTSDRIVFDHTAVIRSEHGRWLEERL